MLVAVLRSTEEKVMLPATIDNVPVVPPSTNADEAVVTMSAFAKLVFIWMVRPIVSKRASVFAPAA